MWGVGCGDGGTKDDLNGLGQTDKMEKEATSQIPPRPVSAPGFWLPGRQGATEKEHSLEAQSPRELIQALIPSVAPAVGWTHRQNVVRDECENKCMLDCLTCRTEWRCALPPKRTLRVTGDIT